MLLYLHTTQTCNKRVTKSEVNFCGKARSHSRGETVWKRSVVTPADARYFAPGAILCQIFKSEKLKVKDLDRKILLVETQLFELRLHLCMARDLRVEVRDMPDGSTRTMCNPVVEVSCAGQSIWSRIREYTTQPLFVETLCLDVDLVRPRGVEGGGSKIAPEPISLTVWDSLGDEDKVSQIGEAMADP